MRDPMMRDTAFRSIAFFSQKTERSESSMAVWAVIALLLVIATLTVPR